MSNPLFDALFRPHLGSERPFVYRPDGSCLAYRDLLRRAAQYAGALRDLGLNPGDRIAVHLDKSEYALSVYVACVGAGIVFVPLNPAYTANEVGYFLEDSGARVLLSPPHRQTELEAICLGRGATWAGLTSDGQGSFAELAQRRTHEWDVALRPPNALAALLYTSGTTGRSKGAMLTQLNLVSNARALAEAWRFDEAECLLHALPIFHTHGLFVATHVTLLGGGSMILLPKFNIDEVFNWIHRATSFMGVPTFYTRLLEDPRLTRERTRHIRLFTSGSAPLLAETHRQFEARTGHRILERYGTTETGINTSNPYHGERRAGSVGLPLSPTEVRVTDLETAAPLAGGSIGQVEVRGPNVFQGYWGSSNPSTGALREDGYFCTGDLGTFDDDGYLWLVGRSTDLVISGGFNVYPKEVEQVIDSFPKVRESAVIGAPHPDWGEGVVAVLVVEPGTVFADVELKKFLDVRLASFKQPRHVETVEALPRNAMGKVEKNVLRARFADAFRRPPERPERGS